MIDRISLLDVHSEFYGDDSVRRKTKQERDFSTCLTAEGNVNQAPFVCPVVDRSVLEDKHEEKMNREVTSEDRF